MSGKTSTKNKRQRPLKPGEPRLIKRPPQRMAVVVTCGDPNEVGGPELSALYSAVYKHKFALKKAGRPDFKVTGLTARWPDAHLKPKSEWTGVWALPLPTGTRKLLDEPEHPDVDINLETWDYGSMAAEILHLGSYAEEGPSVERLHDFIHNQGYEIAGHHEEEYLTRPSAKVQKTIIRYPVKRRRRGQPPRLGRSA